MERNEYQILVRKPEKNKIFDYLDGNSRETGWQDPVNRVMIPAVPEKLQKFGEY
jgi:hypothetical protein